MATSLLFNQFTGLAFGIAQIVAAPVFIYLLTDKSNTRVGLAEALQGVLCLYLVLPTYLGCTINPFVLVLHFKIKLF